MSLPSTIYSPLIGEAVYPRLDWCPALHPLSGLFASILLLYSPHRKGQWRKSCSSQMWLQVSEYFSAESRSLGHS